MDLNEIIENAKERQKEHQGSFLDYTAITNAEIRNLYSMIISLAEELKKVLNQK